MSEKNSYLEHLVNTAVEKIKEMVDVETIVGKPISVPNGTIIIPVSKVAVGFGSGGSDLPTTSSKDLFGGGVGGGITIQPIAFIAISPEGDVKLLQMTINASKENAALAILPEIIEKISGMFVKDKKSESEESEQEESAD